MPTSTDKDRVLWGQREQEKGPGCVVETSPTHSKAQAGICGRMDRSAGCLQLEPTGFQRAPCKHAPEKSEPGEVLPSTLPATAVVHWARHLWFRRDAGEQPGLGLNMLPGLTTLFWKRAGTLGIGTCIFPRAGPERTVPSWLKCPGPAASTLGLHLKFR